MQSQDAGGGEEVLEGCVVRHGQLQNGAVKIHFVECGNDSADLVVLIHGFPNFWYIWKKQFQALAAAGYHVVAVDLRGYNTSSKPKGIPSYGRGPVLSDIVCLIDRFCGGKPAMVVGHDWGGMVAWALAEDFSDKLKKAVVVNVPHGSVLSQALRSNFCQMRRSWYIWVFQLPWLPELLVTGCNSRGLRRVLESGACQPCTPADVERHVIAYSKPGAAEAAINYYRAAFKGLWAPKQEKRSVVELPIHVIWGELDNYFEIELAVPPKMIFPNTVVKFLPECSHFPMWDDPEQFNHILLASLAQQEVASKQVPGDSGKSCRRQIDKWNILPRNSFNF